MQDNNKNNYGFALLIIGLLFFIFGFITWANSQLIPYLKIACQLTTTQSYYVTSAFFAAYFVMAIPSSYVLKATGFKKGMSVGLFTMAIGALIFIPAAHARSFPVFLTGLFIIGTGLALLQTASNPYAAALGPKESAARRISIMGVCNKVAGILAIYILGGIILKDSAGLEEQLAVMEPALKEQTLDTLAQKVVTPYTWIAISFAAIGLLLFFTRLPEIPDEANESVVHSKTDATKTSVLQFPHLIIGVMALFLYVGVEVISYDTFTGLGKYLGYSLDVSKHLASYTGYALLIGYGVGIAVIPTLISQRKALAIASILSILLVILAVTTTGEAGLKTFTLMGEEFHIPTHPAVWFFALLGFSNSVMWPAIFPMAIEGLGKFTKMGSALLIMAIVGGAVLPPLYGRISGLRGINIQTAYYMMVPAYLFILYFALKGHDLGKKKA